MNVWTILAFVLYLGAMLYIGFLFSKKSNNVGDYFLGGRGMGSWLTALSAQASDMSGWLLMGLPGACCLFKRSWRGLDCSRSWYWYIS